MRLKPIKIVSIMWGSFLPTFIAAAKSSPYVELTIFSAKEIEADADYLERFWVKAGEADAIFFYWSSDGFWEEIGARIDELDGGKTIVTTSFDPANWGLSATVNLSISARAYAYLSEGGRENYQHLLEFIAHQIDPDIPVHDPVPLPWQGIWHPAEREVYNSIDDYLEHHPLKDESTVGLLFSRSAYTNSDAELESALVAALEARGLNVLPVFSHGTPDNEAGALGPLAAAEHYFFDAAGKPLIKALINLQFFFLGRDQGGDLSETGVAAQTVAFFTRLNVPVFKPVISYSKEVSEWEEDPQGLTAEVSFGIAMPEFEGNIEPIITACSRKVADDGSGAAFEIREIIAERVERVAERISRWLRLAKKPLAERKVVFVLHKNECAGLEANVGGAAGMDASESVIRIMKELQAAGYRVENFPESGEELMQTILAKKAIAEFRWTTVEEIVQKKGYLALLDNETYKSWFNELSEKARQDQVAAWGEPPGEELNGVPPSMVYKDQLVITGLNFGHVNLIMQPKRGCAGSRCDGSVCRILHDPDLPPPHQYIATYMYMDRIFEADVIIHVGTHGNLEWLPGKGAGLSASCWPDITIGALPHLYIYNSDNPAEGVVAKRRSYATLVSHMQGMMSTSDTYEEMKELEDLLNDYQRAQGLDPARAHQLEHLIQDAIDQNNFRQEIEALQPQSFAEVATRCHELLSSVKNSQTRIRMHTFGQLPAGDALAEYVNTILRFDTANELNPRRLVFDFWGEDIFVALKQPGERGKNGDTYGQLLYDADRRAKEIISRLLAGEEAQEVLTTEFKAQIAEEIRERYRKFAELVLEVGQRIGASRELKALSAAMAGGYVPAGPSGYISRGRYDILPTGRNFYNVDPTRIPTRAAYRVGVKLADALLKRYREEEGSWPESVGMVWLAADIMRADGEQIGQILHLLGARPQWKANGQIGGFELISLKELGRPRVDINIRVSGITRDCFPAAIQYVDEVIQAAARQDEPVADNFICKHLVEEAAAQGVSLHEKDHFRRLSYRIFCAQPGVYRTGVNLAVYASAWKSQNDLSDIYVFWNGYAYGGGTTDEGYGVPAHQELVDNLKRVAVTFNKTISDEGDFLDCCGHFSNYGGMTVAAKAISGKAPKTFYGDTRDPANVAVTDFGDEMRRVVRAKLFNPKYIEGLKEHGYQGASDLNKRVGRVYGFGATTGKVDNWIFDEIVEKFVLDPAMREWLQEVNPWALEEIGRRLLEAEAREIWQPDPETFNRLKEAYLETEAALEDTIEEGSGDFQGGAVDMLTAADVETWKGKMDEIMSDLRVL